METNCISFPSASPLNGEAAILWDSNQEDFKRKVLSRHVEPSELEDN
jgi:ubiquitin-conjugating enzyme E2 C